MSQTKTKVTTLRNKDDSTTRRRSGAATPTLQPADKDITPPSSAGSNKSIRTRLSTGTLFMNGTSTIKDIKTTEEEEAAKPQKETGHGKKRNAGRDISPSAPLPKRRKIAKNDGTGNDNKNDYFCWMCHKDGELVGCELCPRVFHTKCLGIIDNDLPNDWVCTECEQIMKAECVETRSKAMSMITLDTLCTLLKHALRRMQVPESGPFDKPVDQVAIPNYSDFVFHPMDLGQLAKNIRKKIYGCTEAFLADAKWILHNSTVYNGSDHHLTKTSRAMMKICQHEMREIEVCPDCYLNSCLKEDADWFCEPCRTPHTLTWAKLKGFPFWPAKALRENDGLVDVRFFGAHDRSWVPVSNVFLLSKDCPNGQKKRSTHFNEAMEELERHIQKIRIKFGSYDYMPPRTPFGNGKNPVVKKKKMMTSTPVKKLGMKKSKKGVTGLLNRYNTKKTGSPKVIRTFIDQTECEVTLNRRDFSQIQNVKVVASSNNVKGSEDDYESDTILKQADLNESLGESALQIIQAAISTKVDNNTNYQTSEPQVSARTSEISDIKITQPVDWKLGPQTLSDKKENVDVEVPKVHEQLKINNQIKTNSENNDVRTILHPTEVKANCVEGTNSLPHSSPSQVKDISESFSVNLPEKNTTCFNDSVDSNYISTPGQSENQVKGHTPEKSDNKVKSHIHETSENKVSAFDLSENKVKVHAPDILGAKSAINTTKKIEEMEVDSKDDNEKHRLIIDLKPDLDSVPPTVKPNKSPPVRTDTNQPLPAQTEQIASVQPGTNSENICSNSKSETVQAKQSESNVIASNNGSQVSVLTKQSCGVSMLSASKTMKSLARQIVSNSPPPQDTEMTLETETPDNEKLPNNITDIIQSYTKKLSSSIEETITSLCKDLVSVTKKNYCKGPLRNERNEEEEAEEKEKFEVIKWAHQQQIEELKHSFKLNLMEARSGWESDIVRTQLELNKKFEADKKLAVEEAKKKQWCAKCGKEAIYYCCWNTSYCAYTCQQSHWPEHMTTCMQAQNAASQQQEPVKSSSQPQVSVQSTPSTVTPSNKTIQSNSSILQTKTSEWIDSQAESVQVQRTFNLAPPVESNGDVHPVWRNRARDNLEKVLLRQSETSHLNNNTIQQFQQQNNNMLISNPNQHPQMRLQATQCMSIQSNTVLPAATLLPNNSIIYPVLQPQQQQQQLNNQQAAILQRNQLILAQPNPNQLQFQRFQLQQGKYGI
ncbi:MYND-type zinc finger-containing chromatin reader ZMYND8 [Patella vulgata]|uniref:MYND-type zinc finger-containing chromatin reader ZMYND8 n=1 Tax=Patella vulgata TaxID=6465 RepID=UPI0021800F19|nr:MYND-type zinc finger-containing chromatin reader ZMYND8 [Patella vulgata]XP_050389381.1 MYND-type zinc finger-containing chromatin reader ZMYND8 [Patella vulgata]XP_050389382.1 MYND-type zinc finger-containing chromatin reader ZMYND8 [Patella vulgata]